MAKRTIGIAFGERDVRAVQLLHEGRKARLEHSACQAVKSASAGDVREAVSALIAQAPFSRNASVAIAMPGRAAFFADHRTDLLEVEAIRSVLAFEMEAEFPAPVEKLELEICSVKQDGEYRRLLVAAALRERMKELCDAVAAAGLRCVRVEPAACALGSVLKWLRLEARSGDAWLFSLSGEKSAILLLHDGELSAEHSVAAAESFGRPQAQEIAYEADLFQRSRCVEPPSVNASAYLFAGAEKAATAQDELKSALGVELERVDIAESLGGESWEDGDWAVAVGLALDATQPSGSGVNFLTADARNARQTKEMRLGVAVACGLVLFILCALIAGVFVERARLEGRYATVKRSVGKLMSETFPALPQPSMELPQDALARMDTELVRARKDYESFAPLMGNSVTPLGVLQRISAVAPSGIRLSELRIGQGSVRIAGKAPSYDVVEKLKQELLRIPEFQTVEIKEAGMERSSRTFRFAVIATLRS